MEKDEGSEDGGLEKGWSPTDQRSGKPGEKDPNPRSKKKLEQNKHSELNHRDKGPEFIVRVSGIVQGVLRILRSTFYRVTRFGKRLEGLHPYVQSEDLTGDETKKVLNVFSPRSHEVVVFLPRHLLRREVREVNLLVCYVLI